MNLVLLGPTDRGLVEALQDALADSRRVPRDIVWGWERPDVTPAPEFGEHDLLVVLPDTPWADAWRSHLSGRGLTFAVVQGQAREWVHNIRFAWARHARSQTGQRPEIKPRYISACDNCADPECEHRLFGLIKRGL